MWIVKWSTHSPVHCAPWLCSHCSSARSTKKTRIDSQFLRENHLVWGALTDTGTDFCVSTWLRTVTACLNVVAKRDGAALPRLPSFSPVWCQLACLSISRVKYKKANHINVTSKDYRCQQNCPHFNSNSLASRIGKGTHNEGALWLFFGHMGRLHPRRETYTNGNFLWNSLLHKSLHKNGGMSY